MIYEDALIRIEQPEKGTTHGHLIVKPQTDASTVDDLDPRTMTRLSTAASYAATVLFETLGVQGTNLVLNERPVRYDVVARAEGDDWQHQWSPRQLDEHEMRQAAEKIQDSTPLEEPAPQETAPATPAEQPSEEKTVDELEEEENYLIRQLHRVP